MIDPAEVHGRRVAMVAWGEHEDGSDDVVVFAATAHWDGERMLLRFVSNASELEMEADWLARLRAVEPRVKDKLLDADYLFNVTVADIPRGEDTSAWQKAGLQWPGSSKAN